MWFIDPWDPPPPILQKMDKNKNVLKIKFCLQIFCFHKHTGHNNIWHLHLQLVGEFLKKQLYNHTDYRNIVNQMYRFHMLAQQSFCCCFVFTIFATMSDTFMLGFLVCLQCPYRYRFMITQCENMSQGYLIPLCIDSLCLSNWFFLGAV